MNLRPIGFTRVIRGVREGSQGLLLTGLALIVLQKMRDNRGKRELVFREKLPVGSALVVRHQRPDETKVEVRTREIGPRKK